MPSPFDPLDSEFPDIVTLTAPAYTVALREHPGLTSAERVTAEVRYCQALERRLGSALLVAETLRTVQANAADGNDEHADASTFALRWRLANTAARQVGLQGLQDSPAAWFDVRLA